ncbi:MAG: hypothetical protein GXX90_00060 [Microbacteriaceae bacterium]|nr:hypothetical protein [Microbacteriaceae bacterium]
MSAPPVLERDAPPAGSEAPVEPVRRPRRHPWVAIIAMVLGALMIPAVMAGGWAIARHSPEAMRVVAEQHEPAAERVRVETSFARVVIEFAGHDDAARLEVSTSSRDGADRAPIELVAEDDGLVVRDRPGPGTGWLGAGSTVAVLTLPEALDGRLAVDLEVGSGALEVNGALAELRGSLSSGAVSILGPAGDIDLVVDSGAADLAGGRDTRIDVRSGSVWLAGTYERLRVNLDSGWLDGDAAVLLEAELSVDSGLGSFALQEPMPAATTLDVNSGMFELRVPPGLYQGALDAGPSGGIDVDPQVRVDGGADRPQLLLSVTSGRIDVTVE